MLSFIPVVFDLYHTVERRLHWTLQNLVRFADESGGCWPSVRKLAAVSEQTKSTVSRHLIELSRAGIIKRHRAPGGVYSYAIDSRFLPANRRVSHRCEKGVPPLRTEEKTGKKTGAPARPKSDLLDKMLPPPVNWAPRLRGWAQSRFWLPVWGPKPTEPGCFAPLELPNGAI